MKGTAGSRTLVVLADGAQAAFTAGAVAALAERGTAWTAGIGAGLGAQVALLAVAGEAGEAQRRWRRQAATGCPLLQSRVGRERERIGADAGLLVLPDPWRADGWLDPQVLREHLAPERGGFLERLRRENLELEVGVIELGGARARWVNVVAEAVERVADVLEASASFAGGWGPVGAEAGDLLWGGAAALAGALPEPVAGDCDLVCGFPVPAADRGRRWGLPELVQIRDEVLAAQALVGWVERQKTPSGRVRLIAPSAESYAQWASRTGADLALEWPLAGERNAEVIGLAVEYGRFAGDLPPAATGS